MPPRVSRVLETCLYVADLAHSQSFYQTLFGFETMFRDARMCALSVPGRQALLLFRRGAAREPAHTPFGMIPSHDAAGVQHLCFAIAHDDLAAWEAHLGATGTAVESRLTWRRGGISLYFRDPDGHSLEVGTPGLWPNDPA